MNIFDILSPQLLTALVTSVFALAVALYQAHARRKDAQLIEKMRAELKRTHELHSEYLHRYFDLLIEGKEAEVTAFRDFLRVIQRLRDKVRVFLDHPSLMNTTEARDELITLREAILSSFANHQTSFRTEHLKLVHGTKNKCIELVMDVLQLIEEKRYGQGRQLDRTKHLAKLQDELAEMQILLRQYAYSATDECLTKLHTRMESLSPK